MGLPFPYALGKECECQIRVCLKNRALNRYWLRSDAGKHPIQKVLLLWIVLLAAAKMS